MKRSYRMMSLLFTMILLVTALVPALAEDAALEEQFLELGNSSFRCPVLTGMEDEALQRQINSRLQADLGVEEYLDRITMLISQENLQIHTEWEGSLQSDVLSWVMSAEGALDNSRNNHRWTWSNIDLRDGHEILMDELFTDPEKGREALEEYLTFEVAPELSAHLDNSEVLPLPEGFRMEPVGLTLLYPISRLSTLSDRAGAVRIGWHEIRDVLDLRENGILSRIGAADMITLTESSGGKIREAAENGCLPGIPVTVGEGLKELTDRHHLLTDPDVYESGRLFSLEGSAFWNVMLMTDFLTEEWDESVVQGTRKDEWRAVLGEPESETELDEETADANWMVPGSCDYYNFGAYQLRLYADEDDILVSIVLTE